jgi:hypothetical protein
MTVDGIVRTLPCTLTLILTRDVLCGKLYCEVPEGRSASRRNVYRRDLEFNSTYKCTLASTHRASSSDSQDIAMVYDGTKCGESKVGCSRAAMIHRFTWTIFIFKFHNKSISH